METITSAYGTTSTAYLQSVPRVPLQAGLVGAHLPWWCKKHRPSLPPVDVSSSSVRVRMTYTNLLCSPSPLKPQGDLFLPLTTPSYFLQFFYVNRDTD